MEQSKCLVKYQKAAIWGLRQHPVFDLDNIDIDSLPNDMMRNGELFFDAQKVGEIIETPKTKAKSFIRRRDKVCCHRRNTGGCANRNYGGFKKIKET